MDTVAGVTLPCWGCLPLVAVQHPWRWSSVHRGGVVCFWLLRACPGWLPWPPFRSCLPPPSHPLLVLLFRCVWVSWVSVSWVVCVVLLLLAFAPSPPPTHLSLLVIGPGAVTVLSSGHLFYAGWVLDALSLGLFFVMSVTLVSCTVGLILLLPSVQMAASMLQPPVTSPPFCLRGPVMAPPPMYPLTSPRVLGVWGPCLGVCPRAPCAHGGILLMACLGLVLPSRRLCPPLLPLRVLLCPAGPLLDALWGLAVPFAFFPSLRDALGLLALFFSFSFSLSCGVHVLCWPNGVSVVSYISLSLRVGPHPVFSLLCFPPPVRVWPCLARE